MLAPYGVKRYKNDETLVALAEILSDGRLLTAAEVAVEMGCSKMTAHRRLWKLPWAGYEVQTVRVRQGRSGPLSVAYAVVGKVRPTGGSR